VGVAQAAPVEADARARFVGGGRVTASAVQGNVGVAVDGEGVDLHPAGVGLGGDEADVKLLHPVRADRQAVGGAKAGGAEPAGDPAAVGGVGWR
jgi:hypothetical protein